MGELKRGMSIISERQKHIRIADQSEHHWETVAAYKESDVADEEEDAKRIKKAEKTVEHLANKKRKKAAVTSAAQKAKRPPPPPEQPQLPPGILPAVQPQFNPGRPIGPCFNCFQLGHVKANCPRGTKSSYPFYTQRGMSKVVDAIVSCGTGTSGTIHVSSEMIACPGEPVKIVTEKVTRMCDVKTINDGVLSVDGKTNNPIVTDVCAPIVTDVWVPKVTDVCVPIVTALCEVLDKDSKASDPTVTTAGDHETLSRDTIACCSLGPTICEPSSVLQGNKPVYTIGSVRTQESIGSCSVADKEPIVYQGGNTVFSCEQGTNNMGEQEINYPCRYAWEFQGEFYGGVESRGLRSTLG